MTKPNGPDDNRWFEYLLGDSDPGQSERLEAELREAPEEGRLERRVLEGVERWAGEPPPYTPLDVDRLGLDRIQPDEVGAESSGGGPWSRWMPRGVWVWGMAASALLIFAVAQFEFTLTTARGDFHWGRGASARQIEALTAEVDDLRFQISELGREGVAGRALIEEVDLRESMRDLMLRDLMLEEEFRATTAALAEQLHQESRTRYRDVQDLLVLTGIVERTPPDWMIQAGGPTELRKNPDGALRPPDTKPRIPPYPY